jgi:hypothetical protein
MNELDLAVAVLASSGAGYLLGKHYERKKAKAFFNHLQAQFSQAAMGITNTYMAVIKKYAGEVSDPDLMRAIVDAGKEQGVQLHVINKETNEVIK